MAEVFAPSTALERAVRAGDYDTTLDLLRRMTPAERKAQRASAVLMGKLMWEARYRSPDDVSGPHWGTAPLDEQARAGRTALFLCGTARDVADSYVEVEE